MGRVTDTELAERAKQRAREIIEQDQQRVSPQLRLILKAISKELFDSSFKMNQLAKRYHLSRHWFYRHFFTELGCSPQAYLCRRRLDVADWLLETFEVSEWAAARWAGFYSIGSLSKARRSAPNLRFVGQGGRMGAEARRHMETRLCDFLWPVVEEIPTEDLASFNFAVYRPPVTTSFHCFLRASREQCRNDRPLGVELAVLALDVLLAGRDQLSGEEYRRLRVEGLIGLANAHRLATDWARADHSFSAARLELAEIASSPRLEAALLAQWGYLRTFQRRLTDAEEMLSQAERLWRDLCELKPLVQVLVTRGRTQELQGRSSAAITTYQEALRLLESGVEQEPYLLAVIFSNLAHAQVAAADPAAATHLEAAYRWVAEVGETSLQHRLGRIAGLLAQGKGELELAEHHLRTARAAFLEAGETGDVALLTLDLALLSLERQDPAAAQHFALEALPVLATLRLDTEATAAIRVLDQAVAASRLTAEVLAQARATLESQLDVSYGAARI